jgi:FKBP-type peptidyl-prolyl cis-trans isomerase FkpA
MKRTTVVSAVLLMLALSPAAFAAAAPKAAAPDAAKPAAQTSSADLKTTAAKYGYVIGMDIGRKIGDLKDKVDVDALIRGMRDAFDGRQTAFTDEQAMEIQKSFVMDMQKQSMAKMEKESVENETESKAFFAKNRTEKGVQVTTSGLQYVVLQDGKGASPKPGDIVRVHYR